MDDKKVRMARPNEDQGPTIVGGRPTGQVSLGGNVPRAMEALLKKAAVDPRFLEELVSKRSRLATDCGVVLDPAEVTMLDGAPEPQLRAIVAGVQVPEDQTRILSGASSTAIVALLAQLAFGQGGAVAAPQSPPAGPPSPAAVSIVETGEMRGTPDQRLLAQVPDGPVQVGEPLPHNVGPSRGIQPDLPPDVYLPGVKPSPAESPSKPVIPDEDVATRKRLAETTIKTELAGKPLTEALEALGREAGVSIRVTGNRAENWSPPLKAKTVGLRFKRVLRAILDEAIPGQKYRLDIRAGEVVVVAGPDSAVPGSSPGAPTVKPPPPGFDIPGAHQRYPVRSPIRA